MAASDGVHSSIKAIQDMEAACARFSRALVDRLPEIERELRQVTEALEERRSDLRQEIARLQDEISSAGDEEDVSWESQRIDAAEDELASVQRSVRSLSETAPAYRELARKAEHLANSHSIQAQEFLTGAADDLRAYLALIDNSTSGISSSHTGSPDRSISSNDRAIPQIIDALRTDARLDPMKWKKLSYEQRIRAIQNVESICAAIQKRQPAEVHPHFAPPRNGRYRFGEYERSGNVIHVGRLLFEANSPIDAVDTILHEGRHAYQYYAVQNPDFHLNPQQVNDWSNEFNEYITPEMDPELYQSQKIEQDARDYADCIVAALYASDKNL